MQAFSEHLPYKCLKMWGLSSGRTICLKTNCTWKVNWSFNFILNYNKQSTVQWVLFHKRFENLLSHSCDSCILEKCDVLWSGPSDLFNYGSLCWWCCILTSYDWLHIHGEGRWSIYLILSWVYMSYSVYLYPFRRTHHTSSSLVQKSLR